ncbi:hypothetical protein APR08_000949 [Nocardia amikacinitolerans]|nr:hypothetical protein [Nocardia amikacinitolerans]
MTGRAIGAPTRGKWRAYGLPSRTPVAPASSLPLAGLGQDSVPWRRCAHLLALWLRYRSPSTHGGATG